jgi:uncharacterized RDD family membrane protein YckC
MYISTTLLNNILEKYKKSKENYSNKEAAQAGSSAAFLSFMILLLVIFFVFELILLIYAVIIALRITEPGGERVVHFVLAVIFTLPYMLFMCVFNPKATNILRSGVSG